MIGKIVRIVSDSEGDSRNGEEPKNEMKKYIST